MDEFSTTSDNLDQTDEDILTYTAPDEALEAAAGMGRNYNFTDPRHPFCGPPNTAGWC
jgi:hypothetical protein